MTWALLQRAWIIETGGTLMVLSKRERNAPEVVLIRAPIDEVRALIRKPAPRPKRIRRRPCPWVRVAAAEFAPANHPGMIVLGTFPKHCPTCNGKPTLRPQGYA